MTNEASALEELALIEGTPMHTEQAALQSSADKSIQRTVKESPMARRYSSNLPRMSVDNQWMPSRDRMDEKRVNFQDMHNRYIRHASQ